MATAVATTTIPLTLSWPMPGLQQPGSHSRSSSAIGFNPNAPATFSNPATFPHPNSISGRSHFSPPPGSQRSTSTVPGFNPSQSVFASNTGSNATATFSPFPNPSLAPSLASSFSNGSSIPERNDKELSRDQLLAVLTYFSNLLPSFFPPTVFPIRLIAHGGACMLLHQGLWTLSQLLPEGLHRRTTTRDVDIIERCFKEEMGRSGIPDAVERLRACRNQTARAFGLGKDWMNADADVALPMAVDPNGKQYDPIYDASTSPNNTKLHTIFTSPNLTLVSVTPFWSVALKLVRYTKWDPGDICLLLRNGTVLSHVQWTPEMLENWLTQHCWAMGYAQYPAPKMQEMRQRIAHALELIKVWDTPGVSIPKDNRQVSPEGAMGGGEAVGGPAKGYMWSLAGVQGDASAPPPGGSAPAAMMASNGSPPFAAAPSPPNHTPPRALTAEHSGFQSFSNVREWAREMERSKSRSRSKSRGRSKSQSQRLSPQPPAVFGNPNREENQEDLFVPPIEDDEYPPWHSMNPNHTSIGRSRSGSFSHPENDIYARVGNMNLGSNIYAPPRERKSRNPNPWQAQKEKAEVFDIYQASYVYTVGSMGDSEVQGTPAFVKKQSMKNKERRRKEKSNDRKLAKARDDKWTFTRLQRDPSITIYTDSTFDSSSGEEESDEDTDDGSDDELHGRMIGRGVTGPTQIYSPPTREQIERSMSSMGQQQQFLSATPIPVSREHSGGGRKSKSPSPNPSKRRPPPLPLTPVPVYAPQRPSQQHQQEQRSLSRSHTHPLMQSQLQQMQQPGAMSNWSSHPQMQFANPQPPPAQSHPQAQQMQFPNPQPLLAQSHPQAQQMQFTNPQQPLTQSRPQSQQMQFANPQQQFSHAQSQQQSHAQFAHPVYHQQSQSQQHQQPQAPGMGIYMTPHISQNPHHPHRQSGIYQNPQPQQSQSTNSLGLF